MKGKKTEESENKLEFLGSTWFPFVVRNMSFWHQCQTVSGYGKYYSDYGINKGHEAISITLNGTNTHVFVRNPGFTDMGNAIKDSQLVAGGITRMGKFYKKYAEQLITSLAIFKKTSKKKDWQSFLISYARFTASLNITAIFGRIGMESMQAQLAEMKYNQDEIAKIISEATYPSEHTPLFLSQFELYKIAVTSQKKKWDDREREMALQKWLEKNQHIPVNFCEEPWTMKDAQAQLMQIEKSDAGLSLKKILLDHKTRVSIAKETNKKLGNKKFTRLAQAIGKATILNEFRKNVFSRVSLGYRPVFKIIAEKGGSDNWRDSFYLAPEEMTEMLFGKPFKIEGVKQQRKVTAHYFSDDKMTPLPKEVTGRFMKHVNSLLGKSSEVVITEEIKEIKGFSASKGKVRGIVKVVFSLKDFAKVNSGDILVAQATSVDFISVMEKAAAFVTNEGGITSHASIVSREMGKPCIIGTKIATKVLKDGDLVEVDAERGIVTIVKRKQ